MNDPVVPDIASFYVPFPGGVAAGSSCIWEGARVGHEYLRPEELRHEEAGRRVAPLAGRPEKHIYRRALLQNTEPDCI